MIGYETMVITDPGLTDEQNSVVIAKFKNIIEREGGKTIYESNWGRKRLAYEVKKKDFGHYHLLFMTGNGTLVEELERQFRYEEKVIKYSLVRVDDLEIAYTKFEAIKADPSVNVKAIMEEEQ